MNDASPGDFYSPELLLDPPGRELARRVREFMEKNAGPVIGDYWTGPVSCAVSTLIAGRPITGTSAFV